MHVGAKGEINYAHDQSAFWNNDDSDIFAALAGRATHVQFHQRWVPHCYGCTHTHTRDCNHDSCCLETQAALGSDSINRSSSSDCSPDNSWF